MRIGNAITTLQGQNSHDAEPVRSQQRHFAVLRADRASAARSADRTSGELRDGVLFEPLNAQMTYTRGIDFEANYSHGSARRPVLGPRPGLLPARPVHAADSRAAAAKCGRHRGPADDARHAVPQVQARRQFSVDVQQRYWSGSVVAGGPDAGLLRAVDQAACDAYTALTLSHQLGREDTQIYFSHQQPVRQAADGLWQHRRRLGRARACSVATSRVRTCSAGTSRWACVTAAGSNTFASGGLDSRPKPKTAAVLSPVSGPLRRARSFLGAQAP